ncbi:hypothetical protein TRVA0_045S00848 [Trichomonascus vanleenenianus]|uniref:protein kinase NNK1 n=1 Tax=Trichomonascus vanleenenianus TaxID=2268995 RepID=UPI003ECBAD2C
MSNDDWHNDSKSPSPSSTQRGFALRLDTSSPPRPQLLRHHNDPSSASSAKRSFLSESLRRQDQPTPSIDSVSHNSNFDRLRDMLQTHVNIPSSSPPPAPSDLDFNITPEAAMSPTMGLSEAEWKAIPFSTRRKLKVAVQQQYSQGNSPTDDRSTSLPSSVVTKHPSRPIPFSQRQRDRSATMYPINTRSVSQISTDSSSPSNSPAFQFLSRLGATADAVTGGSNNNNNNNSSASFGGDELGEQVGDYIIGKLIGYGGFSQVKEAHAMENGKKVVRAVKIVQKYNPQSTPEYMERVQCEFDHEVAIWKTLDHEYILRLLSVEDNAKAIYCFTEKITGGTLFDLVKNHRGTLAVPLIKQYAYQLSSALLYLHDTMRIVHRDVKLENCLLEEMPDGTTKLLLCDFGMSDYYEPNDDASTTKSGDDNNNDKTEKSSTKSSRQNGCNSHNVIGPSDTSSLFNQYHTHTPDGAHSEGSSYFASSHHSSSHGTPDVHSEDPMATPPLHDPLRIQHSRAHLSQLTKEPDNGSTSTNQSNNNSASRSGGGTYSKKGGGGDPVSPTGVQVRDWHAPPVEKLLNSSTTQNFGSLPYACPQLLTSSVPIIDPSVDMWSYGVVVHALFMGHLPWNHAFLPKLRMMILQGDWDKSSLEIRGGKLAREVCERCLDMDWETRAQIREIVEHPWLREERRLYGPSGRRNRDEDRMWSQPDVD